MLIFLKGIVKIMIFLLCALLMMYTQQNPEFSKVENSSMQVSSIVDDFKTLKWELSSLENQGCYTDELPKGKEIGLEERLFNKLIDFSYEQIRDYYIHYNPFVVNPNYYCERDIEDYLVLFTDPNMTHRCRMELFKEHLNL